MRIIFVKDHLIDDDMGIWVNTGRRGTLIDEATGKIELDEIEVMNGGNPFNKSNGEIYFIEDIDKCLEEGEMRGEIVYGTIEGVQPSFYISLRKDS